FHDSDDLASFTRAAKIMTISKSPKPPKRRCSLRLHPFRAGHLLPWPVSGLFDNKLFLWHGHVELHGGGFYGEGLWTGVLDYRQRKLDSGLLHVIAVGSGLRNVTHGRVVGNDHSHLQPRLSVKVHGTLATQRECIVDNVSIPPVNLFNAIERYGNTRFLEPAL